MWRRWGTPQIFFLAFIDELEKQIIIRKTVEIILIFTMLHFSKKYKEKHPRYHYQNLDDKIYSSWNIEQNILKLVILGHFYPLKTPKIKILKNEKICWRYHFTHVHQKIIIMWCIVPEIWSVTDNFLSLWIVFCPFTTFCTQKIKIFKN